MSDASRSPKTAEVSAADVVSAAERARWQRVSDIVADALEIADAGERQQWVNAACGDDTVIRAEVEQFLRLSESDTHALERAQAAQHVRDALADAARAAEVLEASSWLGRRLGAWEIVAEIARGGMGARPRHRRKRVGHGRPGMTSKASCIRWQAIDASVPRLDGALGSGVADQPIFRSAPELRQKFTSMLSRKRLAHSLALNAGVNSGDLA